MNRFAAVFLLGVIALPSCHRNPIMAELEDIESYIQPRPDSALAAMRSIDTTGLNTGELRAKYSLLHAMALDKNYIDATDIGILEPALKYYRGSGNERMMVNYYAGRIYENAQGYPEALVHFNLALDDVSSQDYLYQGLICASLADIYHKSYSFADELRYKKKSLEYFEALNDPEYIDLGIYGLANAWHNNRDFNKADSLYRIVCAHGDTLRPLAVSARIAMADNAIKSGEFDPEAVLQLYKTALDNSGVMALEDYYEYAYLLTRLKRYKESEKLLEQLSSYPATYSSKWWCYKIEKDRGNIEKAESLLEESIQLQNLLVRDKIAQSVFKTQSDYFRHAMLSTRQEKTILRQRYILAIMILVIVSAIITLLFIRKKSLISMENDRLLLAMDESEKMLGIMKLDFENKYSVIKEESAVQKRKVMELQKMYAGLYQRQFSEIGKHYDASFNCNPDKASQRITKQVAAEINLILSEISVQYRNQSKFEGRINRDADNIIAKIRKDYPRYSEDDIRLICYIVAGFDATTISVLMNITSENARVKKHRIRGRLLRNSGENAELYRIWFE